MKNQISKTELLEQLQYWIESERKFLQKQVLPNVIKDSPNYELVMAKMTSYINGKVSGMELVKNLIESHS
jgi:hypothetical protein